MIDMSIIVHLSEHAWNSYASMSVPQEPSFHDRIFREDSDSLNYTIDPRERHKTTVGRMTVIFATSDVLKKFRNVLEGTKKRILALVQYWALG